MTDLSTYLTKLEKMARDAIPMNCDTFPDDDVSCPAVDLPPEIILALVEVVKHFAEYERLMDLNQDVAAMVEYAAASKALESVNPQPPRG